MSMRLVRAEVLKLRTRRGLMAASLLLTVVATVVLELILLALHVTEPSQHRIVGGINHFNDGLYTLTQLATVAAVLVGATAGAGDLAAGFFRNLVVTGRPRAALFAARIPGGLAVLLPMTAVAYIVLALFSFVVPGGTRTPGATLLVESGLWFELYIGVMFLLALGLASLFGSRATTIGILAGLQLLVTPLVQGLRDPGVGADSVLGLALWRLAPREILNGAPPGHLAESVAAALAVVLLWMAAALGLGAWRTVTRDA